MEALNEHLRAGHFKVYGGSNWTLDRIREAIEYAEEHDLMPPAVNSPNYGLANQVENPMEAGLRFPQRAAQQSGARLARREADAGIRLLQPRARIVFGASFAGKL